MGENSITRYYIAEENLVGRVKERKADSIILNKIQEKFQLEEEKQKCICK